MSVECSECGAWLYLNDGLVICHNEPHLYTVTEEPLCIDCIYEWLEGVQEIKWDIQGRDFIIRVPEGAYSIDEEKKETLRQCCKLLNSVFRKTMVLEGVKNHGSGETAK